MARRGFTLIEVLVTLLLITIGLVGALRGLRSLAAADAKARRVDLLQDLAARKLEELRVTETVSNMEDKGDFTDQGYPLITWTLTNEPSGSDNLNQVTITATLENDSQSLTELIYAPPTNGSTAQNGATGGTGR